MALLGVKPFPKSSVVRNT